MDTFCTGVNCTGSETGNLFYNVLGGTADTSIATTHNSNYKDFIDVQSGASQSGSYWSATQNSSYPGYAWFFDFGYGSQYCGGNESSSLYAWAVRSGDPAAVPAPGSLWLMGTGLALLGLMLGRRRLAL